jgi:hypothetical protein
MGAKATRAVPRAGARRNVPKEAPERTRTIGAVDVQGTRRILNVLPSRGTERDWLLENASAAGVLRAAPVPPAKDLREPWWEVVDQGTTGSCVGWATADSVIRWHFVKADWLRPDEPLSARFIWMAAKETDEFITQPTTFIEEDGTSLKAALDIARKYGTVPDTALPFKTGTLYPHPAKTFYALAARLKIASYFNLGTSPARWRQWLATQGPILTRLDVDDTFNNATGTQGKLRTYKPATAIGGHAVALVGYTQEGFIVRNSWGTEWGDGGYAYASNSYAQAAFTEAYGVSL